MITIILMAFFSVSYFLPSMERKKIITIRYCTILCKYFGGHWFFPFQFSVLSMIFNGRCNLFVVFINFFLC